MRAADVGCDVDSSSHVVTFRVSSFLLGVAVIIDALVQHASAVQWVAGLILVGIVPPEAVADHFRRRNE
jgi:hypothetical protein